MSKLRDFSKLDIRDGVIHYQIYQQDGSLQPMTVRDSYEMRLFVSWVQIHDRYTPASLSSADRDNGVAEIARPQNG